MGMFDYIKYQGRDFQMKDFACEMDNYLIEGDRLLLLDGHWEPPFPSEDRQWVADPPLDTNFHGFVNFYTNNDGDEREEYNAKFTDGKLVSVQRVENATP